MLLQQGFATVFPREHMPVRPSIPSLTGVDRRNKSCEDDGWSIVIDEEQEARPVGLLRQGRLMHPDSDKSAPTAR